MFRCVVLLLALLAVTANAGQGSFQRTLRAIEGRSAVGRDLGYLLRVALDPYQHESLRRAAAFGLFKQHVEDGLVGDRASVFATQLIESDEPVVQYFGELMRVTLRESTRDIYPESLGLYQKWTKTPLIQVNDPTVWLRWAARVQEPALGASVWALSTSYLVAVATETPSGSCAPEFNSSNRPNSPPL